jgi:hypothetical protein
LEIELKRIYPICSIITFLLTLCCLFLPLIQSARAADHEESVNSVLPLRLLAGNSPPGRISDCIPSITPDFLDKMQHNYRRVVPEDCQTTDLAPPIFIWTEPRDKPERSVGAYLRDITKPFEITVRRGSVVVVNFKTFRTAAVFSSKDGVWSTGDYAWTLALVTKAGARLESSPRRFRILPTASALDWPSGKSLATKVAAMPFPRALPAGKTFNALKEKIESGDYRGPWEAFERSARNQMSSLVYPLPKEPIDANRHAQGSPESISGGLALQNPAQNEQRLIQSLAYVYRLTSDYTVRDAALTRMRNLASWSLTGATARNPDFDLSNRAIYRALAEGLDVLWDKIDPIERDAWIQVVRSRMQPILKAFDGFDTEPFDSHLVGETAVALETLLHVAGMPGFPEAEGWLAEAWERYRVGFNVWGGEDGGFGNGVAYGWYTLELTATANAALRVIAGVDMSQHPYFKRAGQFNMAFVAPLMNGLFVPFGDQGEMTRFFSSNVTDAYRLHSALARNPEDEWYWRANPTTMGSKSNPRLSPWHFLMLALEQPPVSPRESRATSYVSGDAGVGAIFSRMTDPSRSALYLRASRFGSVSHVHADQNAIAFDSHGQNMLISSGYYPWYGSAHHMGVTRLTRFKNALTFDGGIGQNETVEKASQPPMVPGLTNYSMDNHGEIVNFFDGPRWGVLTGDASNAWQPRQRGFPYTYGPSLVEAAFRSAAYDRRERIAVIYDFAKSGKARSWELNFHALSPFELKGSTFRIERRGVSLCIDIHGPAGKFDVSKGFPIAPEKPYPSEQYPEQYHSRFTVAKPDTGMTSITVLREDCADTPVLVRFEGAKATVSIGKGKAIAFDRKQVWLPQ